MGNKNKIIIFISVLVIVVAVSSLFYFLKSNESNVGQKRNNDQSKDKIEERGTETENKSEDEMNERSQKFFDRIKEARSPRDINEKQTSNEYNCDTLSDEELVSRCQKYRKIKEAVENNNLEVCDNFSGEWKDACLLKISEKQNDPYNICGEIKEEKIKNTCFMENAVSRNMPEICEKVDSNKQLCYDKVVSFNIGRESDINECRDIKYGEFFSRCVKSTESDCENMEKQFLKDRCNSWKHFDYIIRAGNKNDCDIMPIDKFQKVCQGYFDAGKKFEDTDGDGLNNKLELLIGTDPFAEENKVRDLYQDRRQAFAIYNNIYFQTERELINLNKN